MIKAISYWSMKDGMAGTHPIDDALATAKAAGFQGLELCIGTDGVLNIDTPRSECEQIRRKVDASGVVVQTLASGMSWGANPVSNDAAVRKKALANTKAAIQRAGWLGCQAMLHVPAVVGCPFVPEIVRYDLALQRATESIKQLLDVADKANVDLCIENVWNGFLYSPVEFAQFIDSFKHPRLGVYFDMGNGVGVHQHPPFWIEILGKRIKRVHVKDFRENFGWLGSYVFCDLLAGQVPFPQVMDALRKIGYDATLVAEMMPWDPGIIERASAAMDKIMAM